MIPDDWQKFLLKASESKRLIFLVKNRVVNPQSPQVCMQKAAVFPRYAIARFAGELSCAAG